MVNHIMTKQCGTCKWWDSKYFSEASDQFTGYCTEPSLSADHTEDDPLIKDETEGQDCSVYEERKGWK